MSQTELDSFEPQDGITVRRLDVIDQTEVFDDLTRLDALVNCGGILLRGLGNDSEFSNNRSRIYPFKDLFPAKRVSSLRSASDNLKEIGEGRFGLLFLPGTDTLD
ncbi:hypothetical protein [Kiloniella sp. EL199]|uniref:hypothetical protein n=1 Tax=Kiloniella sp. EL199 TaxID=2107581 RepID=UPI001C1F8E0D|nr:hypothetical protein [Kiloniella sp. EL199]